jgi:hypothetical protein
MHLPVTLTYLNTDSTKWGSEFRRINFVLTINDSRARLKNSAKRRIEMPKSFDGWNRRDKHRDDDEEKKRHHHRRHRRHDTTDDKKWDD